MTTTTSKTSKSAQFPYEIARYDENFGGWLFVDNGRQHGWSAEDALQCAAGKAKAHRARYKTEGEYRITVVGYRGKVLTATA